MATALDPTMELIRSFDDPAKWIVTSVVAFVPHERDFPERTNADGSKVPAIKIRVTEDDLRKEATKANERIRTTGQLDPLTIGHRKFDAAFPETQQPPLVGFCRNYSVQWIEREKGRFLGLVYEECAARDKAEQYELYRQFPFRSVDYHPTLGLNGVAALVRPPALNMGTTYLYEASSDPRSEAMDETQFYTLFAKCMKKYESERDEEKKKKDDPAAVAKYEADLTAAAEAKRKEDEEKKKAAAAAGATDANAVTAQYAADLAGLRQELAVEKTARTKAECRSMLDPMRGKVKFDYDREFAILTSLTDEARAAHVKYMAETYAPLPAGDMIRTYQGPPPGQGERTDDPHRDYADRAEVLTYIRSHPGCTYEDAEAAVAKK